MSSDAQPRRACSVREVIFLHNPEEIGMSSQTAASALLLLVVAAIAAGLLLPGPRATAAPQAATPAQAAALNPEFMGMVIRDPYYEYNSFPGMPGPNVYAQDAMGAQLEHIGVRWVRLEFIADVDGIHFDKYDYFISQVAPRYNLKVLAVLATQIVPDNPVSLNTGTTGDDPVYGGGINPYMRHWLDAALQIAARYDGGANGRIHAFEIFNEANRFFGDGTNLPAGLQYAGLNPDYIARLHAKFYRICKNTDNSQPAARCPADTAIIVGGLHPKGTSAKRKATDKETIVFTDEEYLQRMYQTAFSDFKNYAGNLPVWQGRWPVDGIGFHPYPEEITPRPVTRSVSDDMYVKIMPRLNQMRVMLIGLQDPAQPFWITEVGYNVGSYLLRGPAAEANQAEFMRQLYTQLAARGDVANVFWFKYEDFPPANIMYNSKGQAIADPQRWGVVHIPFTEGGKVDGVPCAGGACYEPTGEPSYVRASYLVYRELAGLPVMKTYLPMAGK
jgi:hypothetical protein